MPDLKSAVILSPGSHLAEEDRFREIIREEVAAALASSDRPASVRLIDRNEALELLCISGPTLARWRREGRIPYVKIGGAVRYPLNKLEQLIEDKINGNTND